MVARLTFLRKCTPFFILGFFLVTQIAHATYAPGETLNPTCAPTDAGCDVSPLTLVANGGTGLSEFSTGDIIYALSTTTLETLGAAPDGRVLKMSGGMPTWGNDLGGTDFLASEHGIHLDTITDTFSLVLDGSSLAQSALGVKLSPTYPGQSSITTVGTVTAGHWSGDPIEPAQGGTGLSAFAIGDVFYGAGTTSVGRLPVGSEGSVLTVSSGLPSWESHTPELPYLASELGLHLATSTNTFVLTLDGTSLTQTSSGLRLSPAYPGQTSINTVGTISTGHWSGDIITVLRGGTGNSNYTAGDMLYATSAAGIAKLGVGSNNSVLKVVNGLPSWGTDIVGPSYLASEQGLHLSTTTNTFLIALDGTSLAQSASGLKLSSAYPGQSSISTVGTITSGHWSGDTIGIANGGTGVTLTPGDGEVLIGNGSGYTLGNITGSEGVTITNGTGTVNISLSVATIPTVTAPVSNDYLPIYASGTLLRKKISYADLFAGVLGSLNYQGTWNASTNVPTLTDGDCATSDKGRYYVVSIGGTTTLGGISTWANGDWAVCNGTIWERTQNTDSVPSVYGRTGPITAQAADYNALQITNIPAGTLSAITVQDALNELTLEKEPAVATGTASQYYRGDKTWQTLDTASVTENPAALYYTDTRARAAVNGNADGLAYDSGSGVLSLATGRMIPSIASSTNWETAYNWGSHAAAGYLTGLSGDGTTIGSGLAGLTLKTVNSNVGTFGSPTTAVSFTVNEKGLITAASSSAMMLTEADVGGLTTDLANKLSSALSAGSLYVGSAGGLAVGRVPTLAASAGTFALSSTGIFTMPNADTATRGLLTSADWNIFSGKQSALGFTPENVANKSTDLSADGTSDTKYPSAKAVKTYADNLALGFSWKQPVELINPVGETSTPVVSPANLDGWIISPGGDWTSVNPAFAPGDLVQYQTSAWVKIKSLVTGDRIGIGFKSTTTPSGPFLGKKNYLATFDSTVNAGHYTYTFTAPANNDALFVQNANAYYHDISFTYSTSLGEWIQLSASSNFTFGNGLNLSSNLVSLGALTADWNQTGNFAMTTAGDINVNGGNLNTASTTANLFNSNATTVNIGGAASSINLGAAGATLRGTGALSLLAGTGANLTIDSGTTGALNLGTGNDAKTINLGTGSGSNIINIGTSNVGTDTISIGSIDDSFSLTSIGLNISAGGALSGITSLNSAAFSSTSLAFANAGSITSAGANALTLDSGTTGALNLGTGNNAKLISIGTGNAGNTIHIGTDNTTADTITIGSSLDAFSLSSAGLNVTSGGALSGITALNGSSISTSTFAFVATGTIASGGANPITLDSGTTGAVNIATGDNAKTVNIATNDMGNIINVGTNNTIADTINIGSALDALTLSSSGFNVSALGALSGVSSIDTIAISPTAITFAATGTINSSDGNALTLDSAGTGAVNIGTNASAKTITIGNSSGATALVLNAGSGEIDIGATAIARTINIGTAAAAVQTINLGGTGANIISIGTTQTGGSIALGSSMTTGSISIGGTGAQTGNINIGAGTGAQTLNLGTGNTGNKTINIGTGNAATNTINIGTNVAGVDVISIGTAADQFVLQSSGFNVTSAGALSGVSSIDSILFSSTTISFGATSTITSAGTNSLSVDSGTTGSLNIGTGDHAKTITIGNGTGATALALLSGTGNIDIGANAVAHTINIGGTAANAIAIGNTQTAGSIALGSAMTTGSISIGGTGAQTGNIDIGVGTGAQTLNLGTGNTGNKTINIGTGDAATNTINIGTNASGVDVISIGTTADQFALQSSGFNVTTGGVLSGVLSIDTILHSANAITFASTGTLSSTGANALNVDSGTTGALNLGTGNNTKTINLGTGNAGDSINIGTNNTIADSIAIGSSLDTFTLTSSGLNVSAVGALSGVSAINGIGFTSAAMTFAATGTINTTGNTALYLDSGTTGSVNLGSGNDAKNINIGTGIGGNTIHIGTDNTTQDIIAIGSALDAFSITSNGFNVTTGGAISGFTTLNTITLNPTAITFASTGTLSSTGANALSIDSGTTGALNFGTGNNAKTINLGTGNAGNTINIGTNNTVADAISIGSALDALSLSSTGLNISTTGSLTGVSSINTINVTSGAITFPASGTIDSFDGYPLTLDSGTTGAINLGTGAFAKSVTIGNGTGTSSLSLLAGTGNIDIGANAVARTINIGTAAGVPETINIGGTGANTIGLGNTQAAGTIALGNAMTTGSITIGGTGAQTGTITIGGGTGAQTLNIGTGGTGSKTIEIGTGAVANTLDIGNATLGTTLHLGGGSGSGTGGIILDGVRAQTSGNLVLCINATSHLLFFGTSNTACQSSSLRYKYDIQDIGLGLDAIQALRPVSYKYIADNSAALGFIAEEVANVDERLIIRDDLGRPNAINPDYFVPILTKGIQQLDNKFDLFITQSGITMGALDQLALSGGLHIDSEVDLGKDTVGEAVVRSGATEVAVLFSKPYTLDPVITISKMSKGILADQYIDEISKSGFKIKIEPAQQHDMRFSWHAFGSADGIRVFSDGQGEPLSATSSSILMFTSENQVLIANTDDSPANTTATTTPDTNTASSSTSTTTEQVEATSTNEIGVTPIVEQAVTDTSSPSQSVIEFVPEAPAAAETTPSEGTAASEIVVTASDTQTAEAPSLTP